MALIRMTRRPTPMPFTRSFVDDLPERIRQMFEGGLSLEPVEPMGWMPAMDIVEKDNMLVLTAELPGVAEKDVEINYENGVLTISGEKQEETKEGARDSDFYLWERRYGSFQRSFTLPRTVDIDKITAEFRNGVLKVVLPKAAENKPKGKKIELTKK
jgi:HSP20 family protein